MLVKNRQFEPTPPIFVDPVGISPRFWHQKSSVPGRSYDIVWVILRLAVLVQYRLVTDRQVDRQTQQQHIPR